MEFSFLYFVTLCMCIVLLFVLRFYLNVKKTCVGFPFEHYLPPIFFDYITGKIPKDIPMSCYLFQRSLQMAKKHAKEGLVMSYLLRPGLIVFGEEAMKVFSKEKAAMEKCSEYRIVKEILGNGLATSNGNRWVTHRRMIDPAFNLGMLKEKVNMFNEHAMALTKDMEAFVEEPYVDLSRTLKKHYFNAVCESVFGLKDTKENKAQILRLAECVDTAGDVIAQIIVSPWLQSKFLLPLFSVGRVYIQATKEINDIVTSIISEMKTHTNSSKPTTTEQFGKHLQKSLAYILLNQHLNDSSFTLKDLQDQAKTILITGYDTVSVSTLWCLFLLGLHPDIQEKAFEEITSKTSYFITYEEARDLEYLNAIIMESLRLYPTVPYFGRCLTKDVECGKYKFFKGTTIFFCPYLSHRNPDIFPDPEKFEPERFLRSDLQKSRSFFPFSEVNRNCIGKNYALLEMKIFLSHILRNFKIISLDKRSDVNCCYTVVMTPAKPLRMKIVPRQTLFS